MTARRVRSRVSATSTRVRIGLLLALLGGFWSVGALWHRWHLPLSAQTSSPVPPPVTAAPLSPLQLLPGMPPVPDPKNLYSETAAGRLSPAVVGALPRVYVPNVKANTVTVIDATTLTVIETFSVGINPQHVVPSYDLTTLWVANNAEGLTTGSLTPVDPTTGKPGKPIPVDDPYNLYFTPDGRSAMVVAEALKRLDFRDPRTMALQTSIAVPNCAGVNHVDFAIDGRYFIATCEFQSGLVKVDMVDRKVLGYLSLPRNGMPQDIRVSPDGQTFFVADMMAGGIHLIDGARFEVIGFLPTGTGTHGLYPSRDGKKLYAANRGSRQIRGRPKGPGSVVRHRLRHPDHRGDVDRAGRREPGHGQRERGRHPALAERPLRRRGLRLRHADRRGQDHPRRARATRAHRVAPARAVLARPHRQHALIARPARRRVR